MAINTDIFPQCLAVLKKPSTAKHCSKIPVIAGVKMSLRFAWGCFKRKIILPIPIGKFAEKINQPLKTDKIISPKRLLPIFGFFWADNFTA